jgi:hypothetical protein
MSTESTNTEPYTNAERILIGVLRFIGIAALCAVPAIFFPYEWMNAIHRHLGLGELPDQPIVDYLARSLSLFYAAHGMIILFAAADIRRHRSLVKLLGWVFLVSGLTIVGIDLHAKMPAFWAIPECSFTTGIGSLVLYLQRHIRRGSGNV